MDHKDISWEQAKNRLAVGVLKAVGYAKYYSNIFSFENGKVKSYMSKNDFNFGKGGDYREPAFTGKQYRFVEVRDEP